MFGVSQNLVEGCTQCVAELMPQDLPGLMEPGRKMRFTHRLFSRAAATGTGRGAPPRHFDRRLPLGVIPPAVRGRPWRVFVVPVRTIGALEGTSAVHCPSLAIPLDEIPGIAASAVACPFRRCRDI
eukprot:2144473-Prymnesium_polylepis.2